MNPVSLIRVVTLVLVVVLGACGGSSATSSTTVPSDPQLARGRQIYVDRCQVCHGSRGTGGIGPALGNGKVVEKFPDPADQIAIVANGRNTMPGWSKQLTAGDIAAVVRYEREALGR